MERTEQSQRDTNGSQQPFNGNPPGGAEQGNCIRKFLGKKGWNYWALLCINYSALSVGGCAASLLSRFYFVHGGSRRWWSTCLQSAGFPFIFLPLIVCYSRQSLRPFNSFRRSTTCMCCGIGVIVGVDNFTYAWGVSYLSVSTSSLLLSSQLAFNSIFAYLLVRQKFGTYTINCIVLLTLSSALVGFGSNDDGAKEVTGVQYVTGILTTIGAAAVAGLILPLLELIYVNMKSKMSYVVVLETQFIICGVATAFSVVGMLVSGEFRDINREARREFDVGGLKYYMTVVWTAICWQIFIVGTAGMIFLTTSLMSGILMTAQLPVTLISAVIFFHDDCDGEKVVAMLLCLWGFASYLYGEYQNQNEPIRPEPSKGEAAGSNDDDNNPSRLGRDLDFIADDTLSGAL